MDYCDSSREYISIATDSTVIEVKNYFNFRKVKLYQERSPPMSLL